MNCELVRAVVCALWPIAHKHDKRCSPLPTVVYIRQHVEDRASSAGLLLLLLRLRLRLRLLLRLLRLRREGLRLVARRAYLAGPTCAADAWRSARRTARRATRLRGKT